MFGLWGEFITNLCMVPTLVVACLSWLTDWTAGVELTSLSGNHSFVFWTSHWLRLLDWFRSGFRLSSVGFACVICSQWDRQIIEVLVCSVFIVLFEKNNKSRYSYPGEIIVIIVAVVTGWPNQMYLTYKYHTTSFYFYHDWCNTSCISILTV